MKLETMITAEPGQSIDQFCKEVIRVLIALDLLVIVGCFNDTYFPIMKSDTIKLACSRWYHVRNP